MKKLALFLMLLVSSSVFAGDIAPGAFQNEDVIKFYDSINKNVLNCTYGNAGLAISATTSHVKTVTTVNYTVDGVFYSLSPSASIDVPALTAQVPSTYAKYLVAVNAAGAFSITQGVQKSTAAEAVLPDLLDGYTPIGYFQVLTDSSTTFTPGTTGLDNAGVTDTYVNIGAMSSGKYKMSRLRR